MRRVGALLLMTAVGGPGCGAAPTPSEPAPLKRVFDVMVDGNKAGTRVLEEACTTDACTRSGRSTYTLNGKSLVLETTTVVRHSGELVRQHTRMTVHGATSFDVSAAVSDGQVTISSAGESDTYPVPGGVLGCHSVCASKLRAGAMGSADCLEYEPGRGVVPARLTLREGSPPSASGAPAKAFELEVEMPGRDDSPPSTVTELVDDRCVELGTRTGNMEHRLVQVGPE